MIKRWLSSQFDCSRKMAIWMANEIDVSEASRIA